MAIYKLTDEQKNYIKPVFNESILGIIDGCVLLENFLLGDESDIKVLMRRFAYLD